MSRSLKQTLCIKDSKLSSLGVLLFFSSTLQHGMRMPCPWPCDCEIH